MSLTTPYREQFLEADGITITFPFDDHGDGFDAISKNYVKCEVYNADGSVIVPDFTVDLSAKTITITSITTPDGEVLNAPQNGAIVRIYRDVPETQNTTAQALQASTAQQIVQNFDNIVAMIQEVQYANEHFTLRSTLPQRDLQIDLLRDIDDQKLVYWDNEKRKLVVTNYRQDELLLPADKEDILAQANAYSDAKNDSLEEKINGKLSAVDTQIDANADAILKTREDFASADQEIRDDMNTKDSELETILNDHTKRLNTLRTDHDDLGDDVADIQAKVPESASGSNPMVTKQQLATKQDKLTAGDNIIISNNVISATGTGGAGFDAIVIQELPESGLKGVIYLVPSDGETPDVYDEYLWIESTGTFELIGKTKVDLSGYATKEDLENIDALPDQSGNSGKFLMTDGTTASWGGDRLLQDNANFKNNGLAVGYNSQATASSTTAYGTNSAATAQGATAFGSGAKVDPKYGIAIGYSSKVFLAATYAIQLGGGTNSDPRTFKVYNGNGNFELMSADGTIPAERMSATAGTTGQVLTKTDAGMEWQEASGGTTIALKEYDE